MTLLLASVVVFAVVGVFLSRSRLDVTAVLTIFVFALFGINARWVLPGAGAVATPAMVIAVFSAWWWWIAKMSPRLGIDREPNPVRLALLVYLWYVALSWGIARLGSLNETEVSGSNIALITTFGLTGVALLVLDGVETRNRLEALLRRIVVGGVLLSAVGLVQFALNIDLVSIVSIPGLEWNDDTAQTLAVRAGLSRAEGTALHSIEYGVVLAMILPLGIFFTLRSPERKTRLRYAGISAVIAAGIPLSISRSGLLAVAVALVVTSLGWTWRERIVGFFASALGMIGMGIVVPGLIGTFRFLILGAGEDTSIAARLERIPLVEETFAQAPWLGSGIGTFSATDDFVLDNEYFGTLLDLGVVGLVLFMAIVVMTILACWKSRTIDRSTRYLAFALAGSIVVLPVSMATFDAFFYRILMGTSFLLIGAAGALWRVSRGSKPESHARSDGLVSQSFPQR